MKMNNFLRDKYNKRENETSDQDDEGTAQIFQGQSRYVRLIHFEVHLLSCNLKMKVRAIFTTRRQEA